MGHTEIVKLLIVFGASTVKKNRAGLTQAEISKSQEVSILLTSIATVPLNMSSGGQELGRRDHMLFLDGGGMKGLVEIEILIEIERRTGRRITELFDWIVGTSISGIIALAQSFRVGTDKPC